MKLYETPEMEIILFDFECVVTTSGEPTVTPGLDPEGEENDGF